MSPRVRRPGPPAARSDARPAAAMLTVLTMLTALPDRLLLLFLAAVLAVGPLAAFGQFRPWLVIPLFLLIAALCWRLGPETAARSTRAKSAGSLAAGALGAGVAVAVAVGFVLVNAGYVSEYFTVVRDPAVYTLRAIWLTHHASPDIGNAHALQGVQGVAGTYTDTSGFFQHGSHWEPQGASLVPALMAVGGWLGGVSGVLTANLVVGAFALMAVYAVGARLIGPLWALAPMVALAVSMPMVAFSRAPYTEPTATILALGGLSLLHSALAPTPSAGRARRAAARSVLAGLALGATFLARPDGLLAVIGASLALGVVAVFARDTARRHQLRGIVIWFHVGAAFSVGLTFVDLGRNSAPYESTSWAQLKPLTILLVLCAAVVLGAVAAPIPPRLRERLARSGRPLGLITAGLVVAAFTALALRPLYYTAHGSTTSLAAAAIIPRQVALNLPIDPSRSYDENTVTWLSWYFSWPVVVLGALGAAGLTYWVWRRRLAGHVPILGVLGVSSALYLNRAEITPDQIWAMRRYLPVVIPIGLLLAAGVLGALSRAAAGWTGAPMVGWRRPAQVVLALAGVAMAVAPANAWGQTFRVPQYGGDRALLAGLCRAVGDSDVIISDKGQGGTIFLPGLRTQCGVQAVLAAEPNPQTLAAIAANWRRADAPAPVVVIAFLIDGAPWTTPPTGPVVTGTATVWDEPLLQRPTSWHSENISAYVGDLNADGTVTSRPPPG